MKFMNVLVVDQNSTSMNYRANIIWIRNLLINNSIDRCPLR
jgi:hypothetical protein